MSDSFNRRSFFKLVSAAVAATTLLTKPLEAVAATACPTTPPAGKPLAKAGEGMAKSLEYVVDSNESKNAKHKVGQNCGNCKYYNDKKEEKGFAPCTMMGMKFVTSCGWCKSYLKK
jgi:hypothetical protein